MLGVLTGAALYRPPRKTLTTPARNPSEYAVRGKERLGAIDTSLAFDRGRRQLEEVR